MKSNRIFLVLSLIVLSGFTGTAFASDPMAEKFKQGCLAELDTIIGKGYDKIGGFNLHELRENILRLHVKFVASEQPGISKSNFYLNFAHRRLISEFTDKEAGQFCLAEVVNGYRSGRDEGFETSTLMMYAADLAPDFAVAIGTSVDTGVPDVGVVFPGFIDSLNQDLIDMTGGIRSGTSTVVDGRSPTPRREEKFAPVRKRAQSPRMATRTVKRNHLYELEFKIAAMQGLKKLIEQKRKTYGCCSMNIPVKDLLALVHAMRVDFLPRHPAGFSVHVDRSGRVKLYLDAVIWKSLDKTGRGRFAMAMLVRSAVTYAKAMTERAAAKPKK